MFQQFSNYISNNGTAKISGDATLQPINCYVTAVTNHGVDSTVTFADDTELGVLEVPASGSTSFPFPIRCSSFTPGSAKISVAYYVSSI